MSKIEMQLVQSPHILPPVCLFPLLSCTQAVVCLFKCVCVFFFFFIGFVSCSLPQSVNESWSTALSLLLSTDLYSFHTCQNTFSLSFFFSFFLNLFLLYPFSMCTQHGSRLSSGCVHVFLCCTYESTL